MRHLKQNGTPPYYRERAAENENCFLNLREDDHQG
jgi:hypothetical protein